MDQEIVLSINGIKLRHYREAAGLSLKELGAAADLSPSYINEIEKGKKFPKIEKALKLAQALGISYDQLTSTTLGGALSPLAYVLESPMIQQFPFKLFGTSAREIIQLMAGHPDEMGVLARMLREMGRSYDLRMEDFFHTALRCYQMIHNNYFPDLEDVADRFRAAVGLKPADIVTHEHMRTALTGLTGLTLEVRDPSDLPEPLRLQRFFLFPRRKLLVLNRRLSAAQRGFVFARELGYHYLGIKQRPLTSPMLETHGFDQVFDNFRTSYVAGALLLPRKRFHADLKRIFAMTRWEEAREALLGLPVTYGVTPETLFYRLSELVPHFFRTKNVHFTRFTKTVGSPRVRLDKAFNMSKVHIPNGIGLMEHFCRRWLSVQQLQVLEQRPDTAVVMEAQRSTFLDYGTDFFCITVAYRSTLHPERLCSATLGFPLDAALKSTVRFWSDETIPMRELGQTCERCPLPEGHCSERDADPSRYLKDQQQKQRAEALTAFLNS